MDTSNPVVRLCVAGMQAEAAGRNDDALDLFLRAWAARADDVDACVAAHYVARHQPTPEETLYWNQAALAHADAVGDARVLGLYPSLYLDLAWSYEQLGNRAEARRHYLVATERVESLADDPYGVVVQRGIADGYRRTDPSGQV